MTKTNEAPGTGDFAMAASAIGAVGYVVTMLLPDDATGVWGFVCDVFTLWGWGGWTSLVLGGLFGALVLVRRLSAGFTHAPRWLMTPLAVAVGVVTLPILLVLTPFFMGGGGSSGDMMVWAD
jgi:hypothetical protein